MEAVTHQTARTDQPPPPLKRGLSDMMRMASMPGAVVRAGLPAEAVRAEIAGRRSVLAAALTRADRLKAGEIVARLLAMFPHRRSDAGDAKQQVASYVMVLEPLPTWAIDRAAMLIARGQAGPDVPRDWSPTPPQFFQVADRLCQPYREELAAADRALLALAKGDDQPSVRADRVEEILAQAGLALSADDDAAARARRDASMAQVARANHEAMRREFEAAGRRYTPGSLEPSPSLLRVLDQRR